jgi:putative transposase
MAAGPSIDVTGWLEEQLAQASPDLLRSMVQAFVEALMGAGADAVCGAAYGERSEQRRTSVMVTGGGSGTPGPGVPAW